MESLNRAFSTEWAAHGVRAVCLRTTGTEETRTIDVVFGLHAKAYHISREEFAATIAATTHRKRATTLVELGQAAALVASDRAAATRYELRSDRGSPNHGSTLFSKRVIAQIRWPVRPKT